jgi:hypothetical protein
MEQQCSSSKSSSRGSGGSSRSSENKVEHDQDSVLELQQQECTLYYGIQMNL